MNRKICGELTADIKTVPEIRCAICDDVVQCKRWQQEYKDRYVQDITSKMKTCLDKDTRFSPAYRVIVLEMLKEISA